MTNRRIEKTVDDLLNPQPKTRLERFFAYFPAAIAFVAWIIMFAGVLWLVWYMDQSRKADVARCDTACVERGYHGGDLAEDQCICESREVLPGE